jgi:hypothetical protein
VDGDHSESGHVSPANDRPFRIEPWPAVDKVRAAEACAQLLGLGGLSVTASYTWAGLSSRLSAVGAFNLAAGASLAGPLAELAAWGLAREVGTDRWQVMPCEPCLAGSHDKRSTVTHHQRLAAEARRVAGKRQQATGRSTRPRRVAS